MRESESVSQAGPDPSQAGDTGPRTAVVEVTVGYLPAAGTFHRSYEDQTSIGTVRIDAMGFFGVSDHRDRDIHEFFLEFEGRRLTDLGETLEGLLGPHRRGVHFNLVEQITQGSVLG